MRKLLVSFAIAFLLFTRPASQALADKSTCHHVPPPAYNGCVTHHKPPHDGPGTPTDMPGVPH